MHKKILTKASKALAKDASKYAKEASHASGAKKAHELIEKKEANKASISIKKMAKKAHEY